MKKNFKSIIILIAGLFISHTIHAQSAYYDAKNIYNNYYDAASGKFKSKAQLFAVLKKYYPNIELSETILKGNPFFAAFVPPTIAGAENFELLTSTPPSDKSVMAIGDLNIANFADGLAQFLIERGKQELDIAFIAKFKTFLGSYPEAAIVFPTTIGFINNVESYNYAAMMPALRAAFQKDINSLSENLLGLRDIKNNQSYQDAVAAKAKGTQTPAQDALITRVEAISTFLNTKPAGRAVIGALTVAAGIAKGTNAADVINNLAIDPAFIDGTTDIPKGDVLANSVQFVNLISQSLKSGDNGKLWINKQQISEMVQNDAMFNIYLGLIYAQNHNITHISFKVPIKDHPDNMVDLENILANIKSAMDARPAAKAAFRQSFVNAANAASDVSDNAASIANLKNQNDQSGILVYASYGTSVSNFLKYAIALIPSNSDAATQTAIKKDIGDFSSLIDNLVNSCYYIKSQNYAALVLSTSAVFAQIATCFPDPKGQAAYVKYKDDYIKYGTFMANILQAKTAADVKAAIEVVALPAGSYSIKQKSEFNISFNGYVGYGIDFGYAHGVYAPVGFSATLGSKRNGIPLSLFVSIIDVGSLVAYRLNDASTDQLKQDVRLESIISLSAQAIFEIPNTPIGIAAGWRRTPKLFYSNNSTFDVKSPKGVFNLSLLIDIPIFTLHNKPF